MGLDSNRAARWTYDTLAADATLQGLLGAPGNVFRKVVSRDAVHPSIVVDVQSGGLPIGAIRTGHDTHSATPVTVSTTIWATDSYEAIEQIADRICVLLDGKSFQPVAGGGEVLCCTKGTDFPRSDREGDDSLLGWQILWDIDAKA